MSDNAVLIARLAAYANVFRLQEHDDVLADLLDAAAEALAARDADQHRDTPLPQGLPA
jgi:hypothetical protein